MLFKLQRKLVISTQNPNHFDEGTKKFKLWGK
jgi:hypothetical protein